MSGVLFRINHSKVQCFLRCTKQYWYRYVSGLAWPPDPGAPAPVVGKGVHRAMKVLCETGEPADGRAELDAYLRMPAHARAGPGTEWHATAFELFEAGCAAHATIESEWSRPELDTWVPSVRRGIAVSARADRADRLRGGRWQLIDWKTGRWELDETVDAQLDIAHLALRTQLRLPREAEVTAVAWNLRSGDRRVRQLTRDDAAATMERMARVAARMQATTEWEALPGPGCVLCEWREQCDAAAEAEAAAAEW
ncbi:MAG: PD-(D/E)XK nuclease family protein [Dehalococcoidia bacterium]|nr:PD-(D/E)XK nuclease family protein [Dehalococcoidia bacterium]